MKTLTITLPQIDNGIKSAIVDRLAAYYIKDAFQINFVIGDEVKVESKSRGIGPVKIEKYTIAARNAMKYSLRNRCN